jgi:heavy metal sensor kinase
MIWRTVFRPIRVRLTLWYMLILTAVLVAFSGGLYTALSIALYDNLDDLLHSSAALLSNATETDAQGRLVARPGQTALWSDPKEGEHFWRIIAPSGEMVAQSGMADLGSPPLDLTSVESALAGRETIRTLSVAEDAMRVFTAPVVRENQIVGVVQLGFSTDDIHSILGTLRWILVVAVPAALALSSLGGLFLAGRVLQPVDQITRAAQSISALDLSQRLNLGLPDDELGRLSRTFDAMIDRLDRAFHRQRRFTSDASHELRTPLTIIKGDLSLALSRSRDADYYHHVLTEVDSEVDHMSRLVERLLVLARIDAKGVTLCQQNVNLSAVLTELANHMRPLAEDRGLRLTTQITPGMTANVDLDAITRVVLNLLDNAIKYTLAGEIHLSTRRSEMNSYETQIIVSDSGPGISSEHLSRIFERFYRTDKARSRAMGGTGLGLSIARELVRAHGGDITVLSVPGEGSTFTVHLPQEHPG